MELQIKIDEEGLEKLLRAHKKLACLFLYLFSYSLVASILNLFSQILAHFGDTLPRLPVGFGLSLDIIWNISLVMVAVKIMGGPSTKKVVHASLV